MGDFAQTSHSDASRLELCFSTLMAVRVFSQFYRRGTSLRTLGLQVLPASNAFFWCVVAAKTWSNDGFVSKPINFSEIFFLLRREKLHSKSGVGEDGGLRESDDEGYEAFVLGLVRFLTSCRNSGRHHVLVVEGSFEWVLCFEIVRLCRCERCEYKRTLAGSRPQCESSPSSLS